MVSLTEYDDCSHHLIDTSRHGVDIEDGWGEQFWTPPSPPSSLVSVTGRFWVSF